MVKDDPMDEAFSDVVAQAKPIAKAAWGGIVYFFALWVLGIPLAKVSIIALVVFGCVLLNYGRGVFQRAGVALLAVAIVVWIGALPHPAEWRSLIQRGIAWLAERPR